MMVRAKGGISNTIYEVIKTQVYDVSSYPENCRPEIRNYIEMRQGGMGFKENLYKFYILKPVYTFSRPYVLVPNIQGYKYYSLNELIPYKDVVKVAKGLTMPSRCPAVIKAASPRWGGTEPRVRHKNP
jgi:hypothetical protein